MWFKFYRNRLKIVAVIGMDRQKHEERQAGLVQSERIQSFQE